ncbi:hypothetical protein [Acidiphilium sp.]|uniref:hypothetical protein n=1 Tax=Acidiphilium sp. TaxID=527 RepID=UPI002587736D|nr:hypothetical protein [Acidiphilium sp.]
MSIITTITTIITTITIIRPGNDAEMNSGNAGHRCQGRPVAPIAASVAAFGQ